MNRIRAWWRSLRESERNSIIEGALLIAWIAQLVLVAQLWP